MVILTATYNHPKKLVQLYKSLLRQSTRDFKWIIVDDGSQEETQTVVQKMAEESDIKIEYYYKENGGKGSAINLGLMHIQSEDEFVLFVDDDEELLDTALTTVNEYIKNYNNSECAVIHFNRMDNKGTIIASPVISEDQIMSCQERKRKGYKQDGYTGYFVDKLTGYFFPIFEGERYIAPSVLFMTVCTKYKMVWAHAVIGKTEYLEGGITKQGRKLRLKNPKGMFLYCTFMQAKESGLKLRFIYSVFGYAYLYYSGISISDVTRNIKPYYSLNPCCKPLGLILSNYWEKKYNYHD